MLLMEVQLGPVQWELYRVVGTILTSLTDHLVN